VTNREIAERLHYRWRINTDPAFCAEMIYELTEALNEAEERGIRRAADECVKLWKETDNLPPDFRQNEISYGCLASEKAILSLLKEAEK
jgi:hypothetical protein